MTWQEWLAKRGLGSLLVGVGTWMATALADNGLTWAEVGGLIVTLGGAGVVKAARTQSSR